MKTACHFLYSGPGRVVISRGTPRGIAAGYRVYKTLAPTREILALETYDEYRPRFMAMLEQLDAQREWDHLHRLTAGVEPVLQCYERPPLTKSNFCHRRMVADWFQDKLGHVVDELGQPPRML